MTTVGDDGVKDRILLGVPGKRFKFEADAPSVSFAPGCVRTGDVAAVVEFIHASRA